MGNSWREFETCIDLKKPFTQRGNVASYELVLKDELLESKKIDGDKLKQEKRVVSKIADAFFFISEKSKNNRVQKEKVIIVETKGTDFEHACEQLEEGFKMLSRLEIEMNGRIVGKSIPALTQSKQYLTIQKIFKGRVRAKSIKMIETFSSFNESTIK